MGKSDQLTKVYEFQVAAFYCFKSLKQEEITSLFDEVILVANNLGVRGMVLFATEGINGTICGSPSDVNSLLKLIELGLVGSSLDIKYSSCSKQAFRRFRARRKAEIVTMGINDVNPINLSGSYIEPGDWNKYLDDPKTLVIDTRNEYEIAVGSFEGALNPHTETFGDFPNWVDETLMPIVEDLQPRQIAMFCTGGIRCEKATSFLIDKGLQGVSQLHGGILRYLEAIPQEQSRWKGECFVFDRRVALNHELLPGVHRLCNACGMPLSPADLEKSSYIRGIKCHYCEDRFSDEDRERFADRQKHIDGLSANSPEITLWPNP